MITFTHVSYIIYNDVYYVCFLNIFPMNQLAIVIIRAPRNADLKPSTSNPSTTVDTNQNNKALMTNVNKPRLNKFTGNVSNNKIGRIIAFTSPSTKAATNAAYQPLTPIPGKYIARRSNVAALRAQRNRRRIVVMLF